MAFNISAEQINSNSALGVEFQDSIQLAQTAPDVTASGELDLSVNNVVSFNLTADATMTIKAGSIGATSVQELTLIITSDGTARTVNLPGLAVLGAISSTLVKKVITVDGGTSFLSLAV